MTLIQMNKCHKLLSKTILYTCASNLNSFANTFCINHVVKTFSSNDKTLNLEKYVYVHMQPNLGLDLLFGFNENQL